MEQLTRFSKGSIREIFALCFPILLALLSQCIMSFCDRYFLSHYSLEAFKGACLGGYLALFFQAPCSRLTSMNQALISRAIGGKNLEKIAPYTWQMIWASLLTTLIVLPIGLIANHYYFGDAPAERLGSQYFLILLGGNFLFALSGAFTGFQSGIGETKVLTRTALIANICNALLNYLLIYGVKGWIAPLGIVGAAIGTVTSQGLYCLLLFRSFIKHKKGKIFQIKKWHLSAAPLFELLRLGAPAAGSDCCNFFYWIVAVKIVSHLGGDFLLALSFGSTLWIITSIFTRALRQGAISLFSFFLGENNLSLLWKSLKSGCIALLTTFLLLSIPIVFFSKALTAVILSAELSDASLQILKKTSLWLWIFFLLEGLSGLAGALMIALKKTSFVMKFTAVADAVSMILPYYLFFHVFHCAADKVWMANWFCCIVFTIVLFYKAAAELSNKNFFPQAENAPCE